MRRSAIQQHSAHPLIRSLQHMYERMELCPTDLARLSGLGRAPVYTIIINATNDNPTLSVLDQLGKGMQATPIFVPDKDLPAVQSLLARRNPQRPDREDQPPS